MAEGPGPVHHPDPFADPPSARSWARRLRGRLPAPVTVWTAGEGAAGAGLTVSSLLIAEGRPSSLFGLVSDTSDLWDAVTGTGAFVVHLLDSGSGPVADRFAGLRPSPGGMFTGLEVAASDWGPVLKRFPNRAYCRLLEAPPAGYQRLVRATVEHAELNELEDPLTYFRGRYRRLAPRGA